MKIFHYRIKRKLWNCLGTYLICYCYCTQRANPVLDKICNFYYYSDFLTKSLQKFQLPLLSVAFFKEKLIWNGMRLAQGEYILAIYKNNEWYSFVMVVVSYYLLPSKTSYDHHFPNDLFLIKSTFKDSGIDIFVFTTHSTYYALVSAKII